MDFHTVCCSLLLLTCTDRIHGATLTGPTDTLIEGVSNAVLTCKANGTIYSIEWMKDHQKLSPSDRITFSNDNRTVTISPVRRTDSGVYQCTLSNPTSSDTATYTMIVISGGTVSAGAIAGIAVGVLLGVAGIAGIAGLIFYFKKAKQMSKAISKGNKQNEATHNGNEHDLTYENIDRFQNKSGVTMGGSNTHTSNRNQEMVYENIRYM